MFAFSYSCFSFSFIWVFISHVSRLITEIFYVQYMKLTPSLSTSDHGIKIPYHSLHGEVEFKNVQFAYPTRKDHVSLLQFTSWRWFLNFCNQFNLWISVIDWTCELLYSIQLLNCCNQFNLWIAVINSTCGLP